MGKRGQRLAEASAALALVLVLLAGCLVTEHEELTLGASPTATGALEATARVIPTPTATVMPGGDTGEATLEPTPFPLCSNLELEIEFQQIQSVQVGEIPLENVISASGRVPLSVDLGVHLPKVSGEGELPISGGGHLGECAFQNSGVLAYRFEGEIVPDPDGYPELYLGGQRAMNVTASMPCGGGGATPFEDMGEQVLRYEEGQAVEWSWAVPAAGVEGNSKWVLHILCEE